MRAFIALILLLALACSSKTFPSSNEYFEGKIDYTLSFIYKEKEIDTVRLRELGGQFSTFYFKNGNYRQFFDAKNLKEEIYLTRENKNYLKPNDTDTLQWKQMSGPVDSILKFEKNTAKKKVLGIVCDELIFHYKDKIRKYYYNPDSLRIDPAWYRNFKYLNKNVAAQKMNTLFLQCELEYPQFIAIITATSISHEKIDDQFFRIPSSAILVETKW
jgi:hypothetical protein